MASPGSSDAPAAWLRPYDRFAATMAKCATCALGCPMLKSAASTFPGAVIWKYIAKHPRTSSGASATSCTPSDARNASLAFASLSRSTVTNSFHGSLMLGRLPDEGVMRVDAHVHHGSAFAPKNHDAWLLLFNRRCASD